MDDLVAEVMKMGLLEAKSHGDEVSRFVSVIQRFAEAVSLDREIAAACRHFLRIIIEETEFENCSILFWDNDSCKLSLVAAYGLDDQFEVVSHRYRQDLCFRAGEHISGQVYSSGKAIFIGNRAEQSLPEVKNAVVSPVSLACIPILELGVLNLSAYHPQEFTPLLRRNWETIGDIIGHLVMGLRSASGTGRQTASEGGLPLMRQGKVLPGFSENPISDLALDFMPQGICILDTEGRVVRTNRSIADIQGQNLPELVGRSPAVLFQDPAVFEKLLAKILESEAGRLEKTDVSLMNATGETYAADINLVRLSDAGKPVGYLLVIEDMTRKKAFSDKIIQSEKLAALGTMAGGVSHDFNNLLMSILGHIQLILPQIEDEEIKRRLQSIEKAVYDGSNTVRRLQRFTERERDPNAAIPVVDIDEAVKDVVELTRPRWKNLMERSGRTIDIRRDIQQNSLAAINASDLREVLTNLLLNAIDAMPQGGVIAFRSHLRGEQLFLEVSDTGIGMSREVSERIFDPFFTTKGIGNSGLGLSVSWSLISRYGGDIQVKSKPGKGTTFVIRLTRAEPAKGQLVHKAEEGVSSFRLMLVEDDPEILNLLRDMLRLKGHRVVALSDGEKALEMIDSSNFDLVLTDLGMPLISGWEIAKRAKAKNPFVPVVMITGWGAQYEDTDLAAKGVDLMLSKPLSWDKLLSSIEKLL
ncbi:MAG: ATP-binding protein [Deltaproteobacteria bacterium]|jgi:PAS domain S-box-containing protein|nr:ATP-binding protein [Deltaproteobacteria bacterium]